MKKQKIVHFSETDDTLHCLFSGRLDGQVCSEIERDLLRRLSDFKNKHESVLLSFDLAGVVYISSAFLRLCLICYRTIGNNGFAITNASEKIHQVFHISGFAEMMNITRGNLAPEKAEKR